MESLSTYVKFPAPHSFWQLPSSSPSGQSTNMLHFFLIEIHFPLLHVNWSVLHVVFDGQPSSSEPSWQSLCPSQRHLPIIHFPIEPVAPDLHWNSSLRQISFWLDLQTDGASSLLSWQSLSPSQSHCSRIHLWLLQVQCPGLQLVWADKQKYQDWIRSNTNWSYLYKNVSK